MPTVNVIDAAFHAIDTDGNGRISQREWDVVRPGSASIPTVNAIDASKDGRAPQRELGVAAQTGLIASTTQPQLRLASPTARVLKSASTLRDCRLSSPPAPPPHTVLRPPSTWTRAKPHAQ